MITGLMTKEAEDLAEQLAVVRAEVRRLKADLDATERLKTELATAPNGGPSRALLMMTLGTALKERDAAVAEEREACARAADQIALRHFSNRTGLAHVVSEVSTAIRARGGQ